MTTHDTTREGPRFRWVIHENSPLADAVSSVTGRPVRARCGEVQEPLPDAPHELIHTVSCEHCAAITPLSARMARAGRAFRDRVEPAVERARNWLDERPSPLRVLAWAGLGLLVVAATFGFVVGTGLLLGSMFGLIADGVAATAGSLSDHASSGWDWLLGLPAVAMMTDPIVSWLTGHAEGLPISTGSLIVVWAWSGLALFLLAAVRSAGARLGWLLYGVACAAMAWAGTGDAAHRPVIAGAAVLVWCAASVVAYRRPLIGR